MAQYDTADKKYQGAACRSCGGTERYLSSRGCVVCVQRHNKAWIAKYPDKHRARIQRYRTVPANKARLNEQARRSRRGRVLPPPTRPCPAACENCGGDNRMKDGRSRALALDHCHVTGKFRGWLCDLCNRGIGYFQDSPARMRSAANYLEQNT